MINIQYQLEISGNINLIFVNKLFRESTIAIWDFNSGKLMASSYTLDKINDIKVSPRIFQDGIFEFCTVGKDQV